MRIPRSLPCNALILCFAVVLSVGCGKNTAPSAEAVNTSAARQADALVPGLIFSDRLKKGLYGPELVVIPAGRFTLGAVKGDKADTSREQPAHEVRISKPFALSRTEITVAQFRAFVSHSGYRTEAEIRGSSEVFDLASGKLINRPGMNWRFDHIGQKAGDDYPVLHVSFKDANAYAEWLSARTGKQYRLPTEAHWEYALRAGSDTVYPWGDKLKALGKGNLTGGLDAFPTKRTWGNAIKNYADGFWGLAPVRQYSSEGFGTFDMLGNVSEWVEDCWHENYRRAPANGDAWVNPGCTQRVVRGSAWLSSAEQSRASFRMPMDASAGNARLGFRVIREL
jgi:formylglycine-generating enzyme required for sulfatase activity